MDLAGVKPTGSQAFFSDCRGIVSLQPNNLITAENEYRHEELEARPGQGHRLDAVRR